MAIFAGPRCGAWLDFLCSQLQSPVQLRAHMHRFFVFGTFWRAGISAAYSVPYPVNISRGLVSLSLFLPFEGSLRSRATVAVY